MSYSCDNSEGESFSDDAFVGTYPKELPRLEIIQCSACGSPKRRGKFKVVDKYEEGEEEIVAFTVICCGQEIEVPMLFDTYEEAEIFINYLYDDFDHDAPVGKAWLERLSEDIVLH